MISVSGSPGPDFLDFGCSGVLAGETQIASTLRHDELRCPGFLMFLGLGALSQTDQIQALAGQVQIVWNFVVSFAEGQGFSQFQLRLFLFLKS